MAIDYHTRFALAREIKDKNAKSVLAVMEGLCIDN